MLENPATLCFSAVRPGGAAILAELCQAQRLAFCSTLTSVVATENHGEDGGYSPPADLRSRDPPVGHHLEGVSSAPIHPHRRHGSPFSDPVGDLRDREYDGPRRRWSKGSALRDRRAAEAGKRKAGSTPPSGARGDCRLQAPIALLRSGDGSTLATAIVADVRSMVRNARNLAQHFRHHLGEAFKANFRVALQ